MPDTLGVLVYTLTDRNELSSNDPERGYGIGRAGPGGNSSTYHPKPAYCALRHAAGYRGCRPRAGDLRRRLKVKVKPKHLRLRPGRRGRKVVVRVDAPGELSRGGTDPDLREGQASPGQGPGRGGAGGRVSCALAGMSTPPSR